MFEDKTAEVILADMLGRVGNEYDKREGSVIYNALAPIAYRLADMYAALDDALDETFPDTCSVDNLNRRARALGIPEQIQAVYTQLRCDVTFGTGFTEVPDGAIFAYQGLLYEYVETSENNTADSENNTAEITVRAVEADAAYNLADDTQLIYQGSDGAVTSCTVTATISIGNAGETLDEFRARYMAAVKGAAFDGNIAEYREIVEEATSRTATAIVTYEIKTIDAGNSVYMRIPKLLVIGTDGTAATDVTTTDIESAIAAKSDLRSDYVTVTLATIDTSDFNISATVTVDTDAGYTLPMIQSAATAAFEELYLKKLAAAETTATATYNLADVQRIIYSLEGITAVSAIVIKDANNNVITSHALFDAASGIVYKPSVTLS